MSSSAASPAARSDQAKVFLGLALGSAGVVYGDIGTSPLYAFKESMAHLVRAGEVASRDVVGVVSLMFWALMVVVTLKYVILLLRFDNRGEGGILSLMALVQRAGGGNGGRIMLLGMLGAGLFFGDAMLTPAISVLSAIEGLSVVHGLEGRIDALVTPLALLVLVALFAVQRRGTGLVGRWFGPVCAIWFLSLGALGLLQIARAPQILYALSPAPGLELLARHPGLAPAILGSVFLTVTGAEALYADMGHFGRRPIQFTWLGVVFPALTLNYLGQGALVLCDPSTVKNPFFLMAPEALQLPLVLLATAATVIASQAVISGAFSMVQQAVQLGLLPRMTLQVTSERHVGQVYAPQVNWMLLGGVAALVLGFGSSSRLASAYGISVVGAMITSSVLAVGAMRIRRPLWQALAVFGPFILVETVFLGTNLLKVAHGGYVPLLVAGATILVMWTWRRGQADLARAEQSDVALSTFLPLLLSGSAMRARGTAVYLTAQADAVPVALLHNLKHNQVLHEQVVLLTVKVAARPRVPDAERVTVADLAPGIKAMTLTSGFMETPDVSRAIALARTQGLKLDIMRTSFFLSRRTIIAHRGRGLRRLQDLLFVFLARNAARTADFFRLPPSRVVELGAQVAL